MNKIERYEYLGSKVVIGKVPDHDLWRASIDGRTLPNTFFKSFAETDSYVKEIIEARKRVSTIFNDIWSKER